MNKKEQRLLQSTRCLIIKENKIRYNQSESGINSETSTIFLMLKQNKRYVSLKNQDLRLFRATGRLVTVYQTTSLHSDSGIISPSQTISVVEQSSSVVDRVVPTWNLRIDSQTRNCGCGGLGAGLLHTVPGLCSGNFGNGRGGVGLGRVGPAPRRWYRQVLFLGSE